MQLDNLMRSHTCKCDRINITEANDAIRTEQPGAIPRHQRREAIMSPLTLVSHHLCPYVQRAAIALDEKGVAFERVIIDLAAKPEWFRPSRPSGRCRCSGSHDQAGRRCCSRAPSYASSSRRRRPGQRCIRAIQIERAQHRAWIEFALIHPERHLHDRDGRRCRVLRRKTTGVDR